MGINICFHEIFLIAISKLFLKMHQFKNLLNMEKFLLFVEVFSKMGNFL